MMGLVPLQEEGHRGPTLSPHTSTEERPDEYRAGRQLSTS